MPKSPKKSVLPPISRDSRESSVGSGVSDLYRSPSPENVPEHKGADPEISRGPSPNDSQSDPDRPVSPSDSESPEETKQASVLEPFPEPLLNLLLNHPDARAFIHETFQTDPPAVGMLGRIGNNLENIDAKSIGEQPPDLASNHEAIAYAQSYLADIKRGLFWNRTCYEMHPLLSQLLECVPEDPNYKKLTPNAIKLFALLLQEEGQALEAVEKEITVKLYKIDAQNPSGKKEAIEGIAELMTNAVMHMVFSKFQNFMDEANSPTCEYKGLRDYLYLCTGMNGLRKNNEPNLPTVSFATLKWFSFEEIMNSRQLRRQKRFEAEDLQPQEHLDFVVETVGQLQKILNGLDNISLQKRSEFEKAFAVVLDSTDEMLCDIHRGLPVEFVEEQKNYLLQTIMKHIAKSTLFSNAEQSDLRTLKNRVEKLFGDPPQIYLEDAMPLGQRP